LQVLEQNYQYDLLNPAKLLDKYVGPPELTLVMAPAMKQQRGFHPCRPRAGEQWRPGLADQ